MSKTKEVWVVLSMEEREVKGCYPSHGKAIYSIVKGEEGWTVAKESEEEYLIFPTHLGIEHALSNDYYHKITKHNVGRE